MGNEKDMQEKREMEDRVRHAEEQTISNSQLPVDDVIRLAKEGRSDDVIINQMRTTGATYQLSTEDVRDLSANGVSDKVIMEMQNRRPGMYPAPRDGRLVPGIHPVGLAHPSPPVYVVPPTSAASLRRRGAH